MAEQLQFKGIAPQSHWKSTKNLSFLKTTRSMEAVKDGGKAIGIFLNVDLRMGHFGLADLAKKSRGIDVTQLKPGNFVFFFNSKKTFMKLYAAHNFTASHHAEGGKINMEIIKIIPRIFGADGEMSLGTAVDKALDVLLTRKLKKSVTQEE